MNIRLFVVTLVSLSLAPFVASAQEAGPQAPALGELIECYRFESSYVVSIARDDRGLIKELTVEVGTLTGGTLSSDSSLRETEIRRLIDVFAPYSSRGARSASYGLTTCVGACAEHYGYEFVDIRYAWAQTSDGCRRGVLTFRWHDSAPYTLPAPRLD